MKPGGRKSSQQTFLFLRDALMMLPGQRWAYFCSRPVVRFLLPITLASSS